MKITIDRNADEMGRRSAHLAAEYLRAAIRERGEARIVLSTGASQFEMFSWLAKEDVDWSRVSAYHLDEYVGLSTDHPASFQKYLRERFANVVHPGRMTYVNGLGDVQENIRVLTADLRSAPIDLGMVGIGENAHIAFNDPPADFETKEAYRVVTLEDHCRRQQVGEGWFASVEDVPKQAVSMTVYQIMQARHIITCAGGERKAKAIQMTMEAPEITPMVPATKLRAHADWVLCLDEASASLLKKRPE